MPSNPGSPYRCVQRISADAVVTAFEENREEIEAAASDIYDTGTSPEPVRVTTAELSGRV